MYNEDRLPFDQNNDNLLTFGFSLISNLAVQSLSKTDMMNANNVIAFHSAVEDHCAYNEDQWEWQQ